jgi:predicted exporter
MLLAANWVAEQVGLPGPANVYAVAVFLLFFAAQLANIVRTQAIRTWEIVAIIVGDLMWVAGSAVLGTLYIQSFSTIGVALVDAAALAVLIFAVIQMRGLQKYRRNAHS